eukprot:GFKZ01015171.1.p1 GENE.GFKZ01015171.1~~GFKZ01015171.1.p1  ORF type:complete len:809 (+),score=130.89 GFKZ01015171.1:103-2427(+)
MGSTASTPTSPSPTSSVHPLLLLLKSSKPLPSSPDDEIYTSIFLSPPPNPLPSLPPPISSHLLRAATVRLRAQAARQEPPPYPLPEILGAVHFARALLHATLSIHTTALYATMGMLDRIEHAERIAIGHATLWQLHTAALQIIVASWESKEHYQLVLACTEIILLAVARRVQEAAEGDGNLSGLAEIVATYPRGGDVLTALISLIEAAMGDVQLAELLREDEDVVPGGRGIAEGVFGKGTVAMALAASASGFGLGGMGWNEALVALGERMSIRGLGFGGSEERGALGLGMDPYALHAEVGGVMEGRGAVESNGDDSRRKEGLLTLAERALELLCVLCVPREGNKYHQALCGLRDRTSVESEDGWVIGHSFSRLYEVLGEWMAHPKAALFGYYLLTGSRRFRTFTLSRTDPDVLLLPLLASLRRRCTLGNVAADAYFPAAIILMLTSDKGFCEAIDMITVPKKGLEFIEDQSRLGSEDIALSGITLLVCARAVQQSLVLGRRVPDCFLAGICLAIMGNVSGNVTNLHPLAAERLLSLVEFLGRRRKKAVILFGHSEEMPSEPPRISDSPRRAVDESSVEKVVGKDIYAAASAKLSAFEKSIVFLDRLGEFIGNGLEVIVSVLRSRSVVSANRHMVYTLLHREAMLDWEQVSTASTKCATLCHMLRRMVGFFGEHIDDVGDGISWAGRKKSEGGKRGSTGISVEKVFDVIDRKARQLPANTFEGLPEVRLMYEEMEGAGNFVEAYSWSLVIRSSEDEWNVDKAVLAVNHDKFKPSR